MRVRYVFAALLLLTLFTMRLFPLSYAIVQPGEVYFEFYNTDPTGYQRFVWINFYLDDTFIYGTGSGSWISPGDLEWWGWNIATQWNELVIGTEIKFDWGTIFRPTTINNIEEPRDFNQWLNIASNFCLRLTRNPPGGVGGVVVSVDKFGLLAPYIGLTSIVLVATAATAITVKRARFAPSKPTKKCDETNAHQ